MWDKMLKIHDTFYIYLNDVVFQLWQGAWLLCQLGKDVEWEAFKNMGIKVKSRYTFGQDQSTYIFTYIYTLNMSCFIHQNCYYPHINSIYDRKQER